MSGFRSVSPELCKCFRVDTMEILMLLFLHRGCPMSKTPLFIRFIRPTYGGYLRWRYKIKTVGLEHLNGLKGPYLVLSNHVHVLDPFMISSVWPDHIRWVAGAYLFRLKIVGFLLSKLVTGIAKQQGRSDYQTIKDISQAFKKGDVVGLFPEGTRTWDGEALPFDITTAKLVRMFHVPVVLINLEGGYGLKPRWATHAREGQLTIRVFKPIGEGEILAMKLSELHASIGSVLNFSYNAWQEEHRIPFESEHAAEGLQRVLYMCPQCNQRSSIITEYKSVCCSSCNASSVVDAIDNLVPVDGKTPFRFNDIPSCHQCEKDQIKHLVDTSDVELFPPDRGEVFQAGVGRRFLKKLSVDFTVTLRPHAIIINRNDMLGTDHIGTDKQFIFDFEDIRSLILNAKGTIELFFGDKLFRIQLHRSCSTLKYLEFFEACKEART